MSRHRVNVSVFVTVVTVHTMLFAELKNYPTLPLGGCTAIYLPKKKPEKMVNKNSSELLTMYSVRSTDSRFGIPFSPYRTYLTAAT